MSYARANSLPVNVLGQKNEKKKTRSLLRRLAKAIPGRKKKNHSPSATNGDDYGSGSDSVDLNDSPLTPSSSVDSLDVISDSSKDDIDVDVHTPRPSPMQSIDILKEVKPILQCLRSDNKNSQERICARQKFWKTKGYSEPLWALMLQEWELLQDYHISQGKEIDNILTNLEWLPT